MSSTTNTLVETTAAEAAARLPGSCFHCGQACPDQTFARAEKTFCCNGCLLVHDLLTESGLEYYYELRPNPGSRIQAIRPQAHWAFLDDPAVAQRLLDFTDGKQSKVTFHLPAIHCIACVWLLENLFRLHPGIGDSRVNFARREAAITFDAGRLRVGELVALLASIGYEPKLTLGELEKRAVSSGQRRIWLQIGVAGFAFGNIMLFSVPQYFGLDAIHGAVFATLFGWVSLVLALPVLVYSAADYWRSALLAMRRRQLTLEVPIAIGLAAIYAQSFYEIAWRTGEGYCDSLTGLIFFLLCGRLFQAKTHERMAFDRDYKSFFPLSVTRRIPVPMNRPTPDPSREGSCPPHAAPLLGESGGGFTGTRRETFRGDLSRLPAASSPSARVANQILEERVALSQLEIGDRVVIRNGELIPADARLISGPAHIDYSFVTGESEGVERQPGDYVYAGGQQLGAAIEIETVKAVSQSYLTSLWDHEAFRKGRENSFNTITNRYSRRFTFTVIAIALLTAAFWITSGNLPQGIKSFTSVLIVACPCALALAAPFTLGTVQRWLARIGVFFKNVFVLERLAHLDTIVFDKTGTLTSAGPNAVAFVGQVTEPEARWIFSLTRHSTHPHSVRISESFGGRLLPEPVHSFLETAGCGLEGQVNGHEIWLGSQKWIASRLPQTSCNLQDTRPAGSTVHVAIDGCYRGAYVLSTSIRPEAEEMIQRLSGRYTLALLSGDNERERERFCGLFGEDLELNFNQSPLDKLGFIRRLQESGKTVMMMGDGLNDAGALKQADVGVAVVEKIGAFSPASDVILEAARVPRLPEMLRLARRGTRIVQAAFVISALYNIVGVSIAAAGLLSPLTCAVLMPLSSVSVVLFACGAATLAAKRSGLLAGNEVVENASDSELKLLNRLKTGVDEMEATA